MARSVFSGLFVAALLLGACGGGGGSAAAGGSTTVTATMSDKDITLSVPSASAGKVTFHVVNSGSVVHSLVLIKTDTPQDKLPADAKDASKVQETGSVAATGQIPAGQAKDFTRDLAAGKYVVICNEPAHYVVGMHVGFAVK